MSSQMPHLRLYHTHPGSRSEGASKHLYHRAAGKENCNDCDDIDISELDSVLLELLSKMLYRLQQGKH